MLESNPRYKTKCVDISAWRKSFIKEDHPLVSKLNDLIADESTEILTLPATHDTVHILHKKLQKFNFQQNKNTQLHRTPTGQSHHDLLQNTWSKKLSGEGEGVWSSQCQVSHPSATRSPIYPSKIFILHNESWMTQHI